GATRKKKRGAPTRWGLSARLRFASAPGIRPGRLGRGAQDVPTDLGTSTRDELEEHRQLVDDLDVLAVLLHRPKRPVLDRVDRGHVEDRLAGMVEDRHVLHPAVRADDVAHQHAVLPPFLLRLGRIRWVLLPDRPERQLRVAVDVDAAVVGEDDAERKALAVAADFAAKLPVLLAVRIASRYRLGDCDFR